MTLDVLALQENSAMGLRRQGREVALQSLYMADFALVNDLAAAKEFFNHFETTAAVRLFSEKLLDSVYQNLNSIDSLLVRSSKNWSIQRMSKIDRAILRLATSELAYMSDCPPVVAINEAIELSKLYGAEDTPMFVNGVLDKVYALILPGQTLPEVEGDFSNTTSAQSLSSVKIKYA